MTVIINGTTGIDTVQDGIITVNKIASGAVTDAKINTVATTKLTGVLPDANAPSGSVIQVVQGSVTSVSATTSTSYVASSLTQAITPSAATSKILVLVSSITYCASNESGYFTIYRNSTELSGVASGFSNSWFAGQRGSMPIAMNYLDSPATTSSTTYTVYYKSSGGGEVDLGQTNLKSTITLLEIAA